MTLVMIVDTKKATGVNEETIEMLKEAMPMSSSFVAKVQESGYRRKGFMMQKGVLFVDTNVVDNRRSFKYLFSQGEVLVRLSKNYELKIARAVYDELLRHKRDVFEEQVSQLKHNIVVKLLGIDISKAQSFDFQKLIDNLDHTVPFDICEMEPADVFMKHFYPLAVEHKAPFDSSSDKGFKDACIVSAIRKYLQDHVGCQPLHFVTADKRLSDCFADNKMVVVHESLDEVLMLENGGESIGNEASVFGVPIANERKVDAPVPSTVLDAINDFCGSMSFSATHRAVEALAPHVNELDDGDKVRLLKAAATNDQISRVLQDSDVKAFMDPLFTDSEDLLSDEEYYMYVDAAGMPNNRLDDNGNVQFSRMERRVYQTFVESLLSHIKSMDWDSRVVSDSEQILIGLTDLLAFTSLDPSLLTWGSIASLFVTGGITTDALPASSETVRNFRNLMADSSAKKRDAILAAIRGRFETIEIDFSNPPF